MELTQPEVRRQDFYCVGFVVRILFYCMVMTYDPPEFRRELDDLIPYENRLKKESTNMHQVSFSRVWWQNIVKADTA